MNSELEYVINMIIERINNNLFANLLDIMNLMNICAI